ncbi:LuxR family transcriptional regulator [Prauserella marina]|uniref:DNA-binding response regulator, NarL/FixJ family, contains REC and HTH domains n=1 Tax=Prauserella marina TaxID=530584 RepID=A0A222VMX8_9PSEU|nr:response regulator transcription factor [Prauserella marina]ASR35212.1 LuxR family transcriptional regulator [Prauserella marina]PWV85020.1 LuxR family two component transcriptional regulator [Prauserella marina]SDC06678.1 DNA-binding response regulator, NarL/FixJ family, contains REC and HTH domains [Prauserella marina]
MATGDELITAVIVDDHAAIAAGVRYWCEQADPPIALVDAEARLADVWTGPGAAADVVIFDLELVPRKPEFGELRRLVDSGRKVIVYSQHADDVTAIKCIDLGALAYLTKREGQDHLVSAIRAAARGLPYTAPSLSGALVADEAPGRPRLSPREVEVLRAWFASSSKELVAAKLHITAKTVDTHIGRVRVKYANVGRTASTKSDLVTRALDDGVITLAELNQSSP